MMVIADNYIIINQVMYDTPLNERTNVYPSCNGEFIELYNAGNNSVSLQGWKLTGDGTTENFVFTDDIVVLAGGYVVVACKRGAQNSFTLSDLYSTSQLGEDITVIYQNKIILANDGETLTLYNTVNDVVDQMYYDGTSHKTNLNRLYAENEDGVLGEQCVSLHRTWVEFDRHGRIVPGTSQWEAESVSFSSIMLPHSTYEENYIFENNPLPMGENYVLSVVPLDATSRVDIINGQASLCGGIRAKTNIQYYDGLGRPTESIAVAAAPDKRDLVEVTRYSGIHNVTQLWLPVPFQTEGQYIDISALNTHAQDYYNDNRPYTETLYELSSLERIVEKKRPGESYFFYPLSNDYSINTETDSVHIYKVLNNGNLKATGCYYAPSTLYKTTVLDEDGKGIVTYTDKLGYKIMEEYAGNRTYYVHDNLDRLRFVLPHITSARFNCGEYALIDTILQAAAYCYQYDERGNMIYKRLPGCAPQYMVYDQLGQLVLKQDGNQRKNNKWTLCAYDSVGRNIYIAELPLMQEHDYLINLFADKWQVEHYGNNPSNVSIAGTGYASTILGKNDLQLMMVNYYDNYDYLSRISANDRQALRYTQESGYGTQYDNSTGLLTGTRVYNLSESGCTITANYYDTKGQIVQSRSIRTNGQMAITNTQYHFDGSIAQQLTVLKKDSTLIQEHYRYTYDHAGRAQNVYYQLNNEEEVILSSLSYDATGQLAQDLLHNGKDTIKYSYDMRGMLKQTQNKHFSEELFYADSASPFVDACYNGNIAASNVKYADSIYTFAYDYDSSNRLEEMAQILNEQSLTREWFGYDERGNIKRLQRYSGNMLMDDLFFLYQDNGNQLVCVEDDGQDVDMYSTIEYIGSVVQADTTMRYDANGNLIYDADRGISVIRYNILNLPDTIQFANGNQIVNLYDAAGQKYKSIIYTNLETAATPYYDIAHYTYKTETAEFVATEYIHNVEVLHTKTDTTIRRINNTTGYYADSTYYHYIKDHLGNICAVIDSENDSLVQSTLYYASGVPMSQSWGRDKQPYLYNGKEFVEAHGLNEYDSKARMYYAPIMRTTTIDPMAEDYYHISPYSWCENNPVKYIDPDGREVINKMDPLTDKTLYDAGNNIVDKDNHIFFVAHGSVNGIYPYEIGEMTAESFVNYLSKNSELWKNTKEKSSIVIALISCETGKGENPIAQQISSLLPEAIIIAPTEEVKAAGSGDDARIIGVAKSEAATLGDAKDPKCSGVWNAYQNGELIGNSANGQINYIYKDKDNF
jgi:RHS repeat-associated protein